MDKLKEAAIKGRWLSNERRVEASVVGALAVSPTTWSLELVPTTGKWKDRHGADKPMPGAKKGTWAAWRKGASPGDKPLWPSGKSGVKRKSC